jgi:hypothetical protein
VDGVSEGGEGVRDRGAGIRRNRQQLGFGGGLTAGDRGKRRGQDLHEYKSEIVSRATDCADGVRCMPYSSDTRYPQASSLMAPLEVEGNLCHQMTSAEACIALEPI